ncbi:MAG: type II toxin-antitoxin system VapC family toxin [Gammaproteobacteria bacterium]
MSVKVVDASAIAALLFGEPDASTIATQLRNAKLAAPPLLQFEVTSVCLKKLHRHPEQREALLATHQLFGRMAIVETRVDLPYNTARPHVSLGPGIPSLPETLPVSRTSHRHRLSENRVISARSVLGGLHHDYHLSAIAT